MDKLCNRCSYFTMCFARKMMSNFAFEINKAIFQSSDMMTLQPIETGIAQVIATNCNFYSPPDEKQDKVA